MAIPVRPVPIGRAPEDQAAQNPSGVLAAPGAPSSPSDFGAPAPQEVLAEPASPVPAQMFRATKAPIHHPYQNVLVPVGHGVYLVLDNWVEVQLAAKVIEHC